VEADIDERHDVQVRQSYPHKTTMDKESLFNFCFGCSPSVFSEKVIITPFLPLKYFKAHCEAGSAFKGRLYSGFTAEKEGKKVTVVYCGIGDRLSGDAILLMECAPVQEVIFAGTCGGLNDCGIGGFIVSESAFDGEGFSRYYERDFIIDKVFETGKMVPADPVCTERLTGFLQERLDEKTPITKGAIFTVGSLLAEQRENLLGIQEKGFKGIEMELSAVFRAAEVAGIKSSGLVVVSDMPLEKRMGDKLETSEKKAFDRGIKDLVRFALEFAIYQTS